MQIKIPQVVTPEGQWDLFSAHLFTKKNPEMICKFFRLQFMLRSCHNIHGFGLHFIYVFIHLILFFSLYKTCRCNVICCFKGFFVHSPMLVKFNEKRSVVFSCLAGFNKICLSFQDDGCYTWICTRRRSR